MLKHILLFVSLWTLPMVALADDVPVHFRHLLLTGEFHSEGACFADIDRDGQQDVISGPYWYRGPAFRQRHAYASAAPLSIKGYSQHFFTFAEDFNGDQREDVLAIGMPGQPAFWFENPGKLGVMWKRHLALPSVGNESPLFADVTGDGASELICIVDGNYGYATPSAQQPTQPWSFTRISTNANYGAFTHGLGVGDVNGDGRVDLVETNGWWEQTAQQGQPFRFHPHRFAAAGGSQMFVFDIDGDDDMDVLSVQNAHGYGLTWFEQRGNGAAPLFVPHPILTDQAKDHSLGLAISQMHSVAVADVDGDGIRDIVTGKRFYAHGGGDPGAHELPVLFWLRTQRTPTGTRFEPHLIAKRAGVGTQLTVADVNADGNVDVLVGNKLGTSLFVQQDQGNSPRTRVRLTATDLRIGTNAFANVIRDTEPLSPREERATFVLPPGFEAQLVAAEPQIAKPMNMAFDQRGRLWVSSSVEYPFAAEEGAGRDTIKILEDTNGDGRADVVTTFADGLNIPMGLYPFQDGVICFSIPHIWFLRDTDGDGKADRREKLFGPMGYDRDTHGMCNAFRRGADGWLYACHGFNNLTTVAGRDKHQITMQSGNTFRMQVDGSRIEHYTHGQVNPFGMTFDGWGDLFSADCHTKPVSLLIKDGYYESFGKPHDGLGFVPQVMEHLHGSTAIGGIALAPNVFPKAYHGNTFHGNVMTSRINRNSLHRIGSTVTAREEPDLLISGDPWFRPSDLILGPDGALYVADFYNRIIGHYEVKLDDPRRDRQRGRIWRIVYRGSEDTRDESPSAPPTFPSMASLPEQLAALAEPNQAARALAREGLISHAEEDAEQKAAVLNALQKIFANRDHSVAQRVESLWAMYRLGAASATILQEAARDPRAEVRTHALRLVSEHLHSPKIATQTHGTLVTQGLVDPAPMVRRAAALAAAQRTGIAAPEALLDCFFATPENDVHLRHLLRMALRTQLTPRGALTQLGKRRASEKETYLLAGIAMALKSPEAGRFIASHAEQLATLPRDQFTEYLSFAARFVDVSDVKQLALVARTRFADDLGFQSQLLRAVDAGLQQQKRPRPPAVTQWAHGVASAALEIAAKTRDTLGWSYRPVANLPASQQPWITSTSRDSADGQKGSLLWSSFPRGEQRTGIAQSEPFALGKKFAFYLAGHDGFPDKPLGRKNFVRVRERDTLRILKQWSPPRNDVAQHVEWDTGDAAGMQVLVELIDADTAGAYAWLAVGRFSEPRLNPPITRHNVIDALALIGKFQLHDLRPSLFALLRDPHAGRNDRLAVARALAQFERSAAKTAVAETFAIPEMNAKLAQQAAATLMDTQANLAAEVLQTAMKQASANQQQQIADKLAADLQGIRLLVTLVESGKASLQLLRHASIKQNIDAVATPELQQKVKELRSQLPDEAALIQKVIESRIAAYLAQPGSAARGAEVFAKNCAACHQVAGKGKVVGPNLDGIGNRGLQRLAEDIHAPSRNVDVAFMSSTLITEDGQVLSGLVKRSQDDRIVLVDRKGQEIVLSKEDISVRKTSRMSPMPANFHETITESHFRDLAAYLLSLRS